MTQADRDARPGVVAIEAATDLDAFGEHAILEPLQGPSGIEEHEVSLRIRSLQPHPIKRRVHARAVTD